MNRKNGGSVRRWVSNGICTYLSLNEDLWAALIRENLITEDEKSAILKKCESNREQATELLRRLIFKEHVVDRFARCLHQTKQKSALLCLEVSASKKPLLKGLRNPVDMFTHKQLRRKLVEIIHMFPGSLKTSDEMIYVDPVLLHHRSSDSVLLKHYADILKTLASFKKKVILSGDRGVGKSTLLHCMLNDWTKSTNLLPKRKRGQPLDEALCVMWSRYRYVIYLDTRSVIAGSSVETILETQLEISKKCANYLWRYIRIKSHKTLLLIDSEKHEDVLEEPALFQLIDGTLFNQLPVVMTCRTINLPDRVHISEFEHIEVYGFTMFEITRYISAYFEQIGSPEKSRDLINLTSDFKEILEAFRYPFLLMPACHDHVCRDSTPTSLTQFYNNLSKALLGVRPDSDHSDSESDAAECRKSIIRLGKQTSRTITGKADIASSTPDDIENLLLSSVNKTGFHAYLSAYYITHAEDSQTRNTFIGSMFASKNIMEYTVIFTFIAQMAPGLEQKCRQNIAEKIRCVTESKGMNDKFVSDLLFEMVFAFPQTRFDLPEVLHLCISEITPRHLKHLKLQNSGTVCRLSIQIDKSETFDFPQILNSIPDSNLHDITLHVIDENDAIDVFKQVSPSLGFKDLPIAHILHCQSNCKTKCLYFGDKGNNINQSTETIDTVCTMMSDVTNIPNDDCVDAFKLICPCPTASEWTIGFVLNPASFVATDGAILLDVCPHIEDKIFKNITKYFLLASLESCDCIERVKCIMSQRCYFSNIFSWQSFIGIIPNESAAFIEELDLKDIALGDAGYQKLTQILPKLQRLQRIKISNCSYQSTEVMLGFLHCLKTLEKLKILNLNQVLLGKSGFEVLAHSIKEMHKLQKIYLSECSCNKKETVLQVVDEISKRHALNTLVLKGNSVGPLSLRYLAGMKHLVTLSISGTVAKTYVTIPVNILTDIVTLQDLSLSYYFFIKSTSGESKFGRQLMTLDISNCSFDATCNFFGALSSCGGLIMLSIEKCVLNSDIKTKLVQILGGCSNINSLHISDCSLNDSDMNGVLSSLKSKGRLVNLCLSKCDMAQACTSLCDVLKHANTLTKLTLKDCQIIDIKYIENILDSLNNKPSVQVLDISENHVGSGGVNMLCKSMSTRTNLRVLDLDACRCADSHLMASLIESLPNTLTELNLSGNNLGVEGIAALLQKSETFYLLQSLRIANTECHDLQNMANLFNKIRLFKHLQVLDVSHNTLGMKAIEALAESLPYLYIMRELYLCGCKCSRTTSTFSLVKAIGELPHLRIMNLGHNSIGNTGVSELVDTIPKLTNLEVLFIANIWGSEFKSGDLFLQAFRECKHIREVDLSYFIFDDHLLEALTNVLIQQREFERLVAKSCKLDERANLESCIRLLLGLENLTELDLRDNSLPNDMVTQLEMVIEKKEGKFNLYY